VALYRASLECKLVRLFVIASARRVKGPRTQNAKMVGRAQGGLADALDCWDQPNPHAELVLVVHLLQTPRHCGRIQGFKCRWESGCIPTSSFIIDARQASARTGGQEIDHPASSYANLCLLRPNPMTERSIRPVTDFGQIECKMFNPTETRYATSTATKSFTRKSRESSIASRQRQALALGSNGHRLLPTQTMKPWAAAVCWPLLPRAVSTKFLFDDERLALPPNSSLAIVLKSSQKCARVTTSQPPHCSLESHERKATFCRYGDGELHTPWHPAFGKRLDALEDSIHSELE